MDKAGNLNLCQKTAPMCSEVVDFTAGNLDENATAFLIVWLLQRHLSTEIELNFTDFAINNFVEWSLTETVWNKGNITVREIKRKKSDEETLGEKYLLHCHLRTQPQNV